MNNSRQTSVRFKIAANLPQHQEHGTEIQTLQRDRTCVRRLGACAKASVTTHGYKRDEP
jgi:hypothetical protein